MKKLSEVKWCPFPIEDIFTVSPGIRLTKDAMVEGNRPFIGASDSNNGITAFCGNTNKSLDSNVLGVNYNGSVVENFYHPYEAIFSDDVKRLHLKEHVGNKYIYLFIKNIILKQKEKFQYGYKFNGDRMLRTSIKLPIGSDGKPDFAFMEQYMKAIEKKLLKRYQQYLTDTKRNDLIDKKSTRVGKIEWKEFSINDIFQISATKSSIDKKNLEGGCGNIPYITRTDKNNGIDSFISTQENYEVDEKNAITVGLDTQTAFYQLSDFYTGQNIQVFRNENLNRSVALYIIPLLKMQFEKFNWGGNGATLGRLKKLCIKLPSTKEGNPDYEYMEQYMKAIEHRLINRYIKKRLKTL